MRRVVSPLAKTMSSVAFSPSKRARAVPASIADMKRAGAEEIVTVRGCIFRRSFGGKMFQSEEMSMSLVVADRTDSMNVTVKGAELLAIVQEMNLQRGEIISATGYKYQVDGRIGLTLRSPGKHRIQRIEAAAGVYPVPPAIEINRDGPNGRCAIAFKVGSVYGDALGGEGPDGVMYDMKLMEKAREYEFRVGDSFIVDNVRDEGHGTIVVWGSCGVARLSAQEWDGLVASAQSALGASVAEGAEDPEI